MERIKKIYYKMLSSRFHGKPRDFFLPSPLGFEVPCGGLIAPGGAEKSACEAAREALKGRPRVEET